MSNGQNIFADSAERLEQIARSLKTQQIGERQGAGALQTASSRLMAVSPDEMWARQFSSQCIGPICFKAAPGSDIAVPPLSQAMQSFAPVRQAQAYAPPQAAAPVRTAATASAETHIGASLGKPMRRSLLKRVFG
jgi:hypothetical protein